MNDRPVTRRGWRALPAASLAWLAACAPAATPAPTTWCAQVPRPENTAFPTVDGGSTWFDVYRVELGVFAIVEPRQFQEAIAYLITGEDRALLFDSGIGLQPIRPVVERLTPLPVTVVNSHTHFDHVGGNAEFDSVLAVDGPYTRRNEAGHPHADVAGEVASTSLCGPPPAGVDTAAFHTRPWTPTGIVKDGDRLELGGRTIEVLEVPGHTPDALALRDSVNGLLWTGDTFYEAPIWLFVPETDLDAYERSIARLADLAPTLRRLLPAHNTATSSPDRLAAARDAIRQVRSGAVQGKADGDGLTFTVNGITIITTKTVMAGDTARATNGTGRER